MIEMIQANWLALVLALIIGLLVAWWLFGRASTVAKPRERRPDVLDEGAAPAQRNQSLIDAPPAAATPTVTIIPSPAAGTMAGIGEIVAVAAQDEVEAATPAAAPPPPPPAPAATATEADDLLRLKGVGPKLVALLHGFGITRYSQIAGWTDEDIARIDAQLGNFKGRITRDSWVEQAKFLTSGDTAGFEGKFGKL